MNNANFYAWEFINQINQYDKSQWSAEIVAYYVQYMSASSDAHMKEDLPNTYQCMESLFFQSCADYVNHKSSENDAGLHVV